jgi:hypothetical protein
MANNILSYFTKDINDPIEKAKYTIDKYYNCIIIFYNERAIWFYSNDTNIIHNHVLNIYKRPVYNENKCIRYFRNNNISYNSSYLTLNINTNYIITYNFKIKSYLAKYYLIYRYFIKWEFNFSIVYFNGYIYKKRQSFYLKRPYFNSLIFIPNKYELKFYSNLFLICFAILMAYKIDYL